MLSRKMLWCFRRGIDCKSSFFEEVRFGCEGEEGMMSIGRGFV